jgi:xanthine dehydrogenase accessory factor
VAALGTDAGYVGAMGSRRTHADREARLRELGIGDDQLARLHSPIGLDLGARTPEEVAVAILAEIIAVNTGRQVPSLRDGSGPLH